MGGSPRTVLGGETVNGLVRPVSSWRCAALGGVYLLVLALLPGGPRLSGNVWSRYMTIESLVERGTMAVDRSPLRAISGSPDLIKVGSHFYSDKPPVLSVLSAGVYAGLVAGGVRFSASAASFVLADRILVLAVVGAGSAVCLAGLRWWLQVAPLARWAADLLTLVFGFGSLLFGYAGTFNNHSVAAGLVITAFALVFVTTSLGGPSPGRLAFAGFLSGLAATMDLPVGGALTAALCLALVPRGGRSTLAFLVGTVVPLVGHAAFQASITGSPLPAELTPEVFAYEGSYWNSPEGRWVEPGPRWQFGLELLLGPQGWLTVTPALLVGLLALARIGARPGDPLRPAALVAGAVTAALILYYVWGVRRTDFAGQSFGTRHLLAVSPLVYGFAVVGLARIGRAWSWGLFGLLLLIGAVYAAAGFRDPWSRVERRNDPALQWVGRLTLYPWTSYRR